MKGKTKIILILVVLLIIATIIGGVTFFINQEKEEEKTSQVEWEEIYLDVLKEEENFEDLEDLKIQLCDFDKDEIPELVVYGAENVKSGTSQMTKYMAKIYKVNKDEAVTINFDLEDEFQMEFLHNKETNDYNWYVVTDDEDIYNISLKDDTYEMTNCKYDYENDFEFVEEKINDLIDFDKDAKSSEIEDMFNEAKENYIPVSELVPEKEKVEAKDDEKENDDTEISNVKNNCGYMVEYGGYKYYWKITENSREASGIYANYSVNEETENELMKVDKDGNEEAILKDKSMSNLAIVNDKIFYSTSEDICSVDLDGENKTIYSQGEIKCVIGNDVICEDSTNSKIFRITDDGEETIVEDVKFVGNTDKYVYYTTEESDSSILDLGIIYKGKDKGVVQSLSTSEYEYNYNDLPSFVISIQEYKGKIYISYGYIDGTAALVQESVFGVMDEDGSNYEMIYKGTSTEDFYIYEENGEILLVYEDGKAINVETKKETEVDEKIPYTSENVYQDIDDEVWYIEDVNGEKTEIVSENDLISDYGFVVDDEHMSTIYNYSVIDNEIYVLIDNGIHDPENDIGWRYSYERTKTVLLKYNLEDKELEKVYEF